MKPLLLLTLIAALFLSSCTTSPSHINQNRNSTLTNNGYAPIKLKSPRNDSRYWANTIIANSKVKLLIDSGANTTDVNAATAKKIKLTPDPNKVLSARGAFGKTFLSLLANTSLQLGAQKVSPFPVAIDSPSKKQKSSIYDGKMGIDALSLAGALIDLRSEKIWTPVRDLNATSKSSKTIRNIGSERIPLKSRGTYSQLALSSSYNGHRLNWIVDTGAEVSVLDHQTAEKIGLHLIGSNIKMIDISGDSQELSVANCENIKFGKHTLLSFPIAVTDLSSIKNTFIFNDGSTIHGILGVDFLQSTHALLDPRSKAIYLGYHTE